MEHFDEMIMMCSFVLDQHIMLDLLGAIILNKQSATRHVTPL